MAIATETPDFVDQLQRLILAGEPNASCLTHARQMLGVSRAQGYRLIKKAWQQITKDIDESGTDRQELLSWTIETLLTLAACSLVDLKHRPCFRVYLDQPLEVEACMSGNKPFE